ncbi:DUF2024 family protein [Marinigracilibium pacificum]|uniref:DUF2024 family protein n=1 Tax=Marinigracilibium pacificum TaxID=2729599 RepID=A0A848J0K8_9BACT|nr:DUF2024 family protein [Marinigracilibium pacificum]NMM48898.1 DUF2024 family protein [Marinigracilibium pacificum]
MKVAVWDTYVTRKDGTIMHFDIIVPAEMKNKETVYDYGKTYLDTKGQSGQSLSTKECTFCHVETIKPDWELSIVKNGYHIFEINNCG